ncbi:heparan-alpha-glucosaminide N-acetyltransferase [Gemmobacter serpentinus]|uniref:heparan-alpha-glucosaminide N-acetyltransferase n=1 Tax=Gemmobacter serpentinus TaxID=2652247 RepID=UPI00124C7CA9|nr:heparan-alpha-glucosaminide N-acetyltransferase [Gemmobacter serpentinus]
MSGTRIWLIDLARSIALLGMALFHFSYDLQMFGLFRPDGGQAAFLWYLARIVAGSFIALAGVSLWLAQGRVLRWPAFWRRWRVLVLAAAGVSLATYLAMGEAWVFFGILHAIALFSLLGLLALRLPAPLILLAGVGVFWGSTILPGLLEWNLPALRFLGLGSIRTATVDFEPVFPWFGPFLLGLGMAKALDRLWPRIARIEGPDWLAWPGRHSLAVYLIHQPVLIGAIWLWITLFGPAL